MTASAPVLVCGSMAFDTIAVFEGHFRDHILPDHVQSLSVSFLTPKIRKENGGCAGNIAYNLRLLGGNPIPVATVGTDADKYLQHLQHLGINTCGIKIIPDTYTAHCFITTDLDGNQITAFHPGAMLRSAENSVSAPPGGWAIIAPDSKEGMFAHAKRFNEANIPFIFDLGQAMPLFNGEELGDMLGRAQALMANDYEAGVIQERTGKSMEELAKNLQAVVVTHGAEGATLWTEDVQQSIPPVRGATVVDPTGCGDAHRAGVLYGLVCGWSWVESCKLGNVMGAIKVACGGAQNHRPERQDIDRLLSQMSG